MTAGVLHCLLCEAAYIEGDEHVCDTQPLSRAEYEQAEREAWAEYQA